MRDAPQMYRVLHRLGPSVVDRYLSVRVEGVDNVPNDRPAIIASNHLSFIDSIVLPLHVPRPVYFLGKADYFASWRTRWFFRGVGVVPVDRDGGERGADGLRTGVEILRGGDLLGVYPEGTRSPDGRLYRGKTGPVRMAIAASVPIVPCAVVGTDRALPAGSRVPRRVPVTVRYGRPIEVRRAAAGGQDPFALRSATDELMYEIMVLSGQEYVDEYAPRVRGEPGSQLHVGESRASARDDTSADGNEGGVGERRRAG